MPQNDNDPYFDSTWMIETTARPDLIYNEFKARIKAAHGVIQEYGRNDPPTDPDDMDAYIIGSSPTGAWTGLPGRMAVWIGGWKYITVKDGFCTQVRTATPGQNGRRMEFWTGGWSAYDGVVNIASEEVTVGVYEANWNIRDGAVARLILDQPTITMNRPVGWKYGQLFHMIIVQDGAGGRNFVLKTGEWLTPGGSQPVIATGPNEVTVLTFLLPGPSYQGPMLLKESLDLTLLTP